MFIGFRLTKLNKYYSKYSEAKIPDFRDKTYLSSD